MASIARFIALPYSPWSIKAKWALDHHRVPYRTIAYLPMLGEPLLRLRAGRWSGRVSVPMLMTGNEAITDSLEIARYADRIGEGAPLFPAGHEDEIAEWNARSEVILDAGRALSMKRMLASPAALAENVPGPRLGNLLSPIGALGVKYLAHKYEAKGNDEHYREERRMGFEALRRAITTSGDHLVGGALSYADVAMTVASFGLRPPGREIDRLGDATRECWTDEALAGEYADVIRWRDRVLASAFPAV